MVQITRKPGFRLPAAGLLLAVAMLVVGCGQTERRMTLTSDPSGALAYVNGQEVGRTPVTIDYLWHGNYRFEFRKVGFETLKTERRVNPDFHQVIGLDAITEALIPATLHENREFHFVMVPLPDVSDATLVENAAKLRDEATYKPDGSED